MKFGDSQAARIIAAIQTRLERKFKSNAYVQTTWATVVGVSADMKTASAYLYSDSTYTSHEFRIPDTKWATIGDKVKVAIDYSTGERWIEEIWYSSAYKTVAIDPATGGILTGDGTVPPTPLAVGDIGVVQIKEDDVTVMAVATTLDFHSPLTAEDAGSGRAVIGIDTSGLLDGLPIWKPVMSTSPNIITTTGEAIWLPLTTIDGEAIMVEEL
jgi:hypothetical protein